jgi:hypothetical protein
MKLRIAIFGISIGRDRGLFWSTAMRFPIPDSERKSDRSGFFWHWRFGIWIPQRRQRAGGTPALRPTADFMLSFPQSTIRNSTKELAGRRDAGAPGQTLNGGIMGRDRSFSDFPTNI